MLKTNKIYYLLIAAFVGLAFFRIDMPTSFKIDDYKNPLFESFPYELGKWKGEDFEVDEKTYEILETRNVLSRRYDAPNGDQVALLLVSSNKDRRVAHPPEVCYLGSNFTISNERENTLDVNNQEIPVKEFLAIQENRKNHKEHVLYLYKVGETFTRNYYAQQLKFALDSMQKKDTEILLIRLSGNNPDVFDEFLAEVLDRV